MVGATAEPYQTFYLEFEESVLGLGIGGLVEYLGVPVGSVQDIYVDETGRAQVVIRVNPEKVTLREGVEASLSVSSLAAGTLAVHLEGGDPNAPELPEGAHLPAESSFLQSFTKSLQTSVESLDDVLASLQDAAEQVSTALSGMEEGAMNNLIKEVEGLVKDSRAFVAKTEDTMDGLGKSLDRAINEYTNIAQDIEYLADDVGATAESAKALMDDAREKIAPLDLAAAQANLDSALENFAQVAEGMNETLTRVDSAAEGITHDVDTMAYSLRETLVSATEALNAVTAAAETIQQDPGSLIRGRGRPRTEP